MTNDELKEYIYHYATEDKTHSAIMLTGGWGTGKSFFIEYSLKKYLKEKNINCIIVSLYGIDNMNDFGKNIYFETINYSVNSLTIKKKILDYYETIKKKARNIENKCIRSILKQIYKFFSKRSTKSHEKVIAKTVVKSIASRSDVSFSVSAKELKGLLENSNLSNKLLIVEDLERCNIDIIDVLGFINSLVEQDNVKVLLVANEEEITYELVEVEVEDNKGNKSKQIKEIGNTVRIEKYKKVKEKTISDTINFSPNFNNSVKGVLDKFKGTKLSQFNNQDNVSEIVNLFVESDFNLRTFVFACQKTNDILEKIDCVNDENFIKSIFYGIIAFSKIYKSNQDVKWDSDTYLSLTLGTRDYPLYLFAYNYIKNQDLNLDSLKICQQDFDELKCFDEHYGSIDTDVMTIRYYWENSEEAVTLALDNLIVKLKENNISYYVYGDLIKDFVVLNGIIGFNYDKAIELMKANLQKNKEKLNARMLFAHAKAFGLENKKDNVCFKDLISEVEDSLVLSSNDLLVEFEYKVENITKIKNYVFNHEQDFKRMKGFLFFVDYDKFLNLLNESDVAEFNTLRLMIAQLYDMGNVIDYYPKDKEIVKKLLDDIKQHLTENNIDDRILLFQYNLLIELLEKIVQNFELYNKNQD